MLQVLQHSQASLILVPFIFQLWIKKTIARRAKMQGLDVFTDFFATAKTE